MFTPPRVRRFFQPAGLFDSTRRLNRVQVLPAGWTGRRQAKPATGPRGLNSMSFLSFQLPHRGDVGVGLYGTVDDGLGEIQTHFGPGHGDADVVGLHFIGMGKHPLE